MRLGAGLRAERSDACLSVKLFIMLGRLPQFFRNLKIRVKLLGGYTLIFILATLLSGAAVYRQVRTTIEANIESELTNATAAIKSMVGTAAATSIKNHLRAIAEKNREIVVSIHGDFLRGLITEDEAKALCRKIMFSQTIGKTGYLFCANSKGIAAEHPNPGVAGKDFADRGFVREMIRMKNGYLEYDWKNPEDDGLKAKAMYITYFEPWDWIIAASSYREEFRELVDISDFRKSILSLTFGKTGYAYITDSLGNLVVHPFNSGNYFDEKDSDGRYFVREICRRKNGKDVYTWKNTEDAYPRAKMVIFNYIPEYDWIVASTSYLDEIFEPLKTVRNTIVTMVLLICVLVFSSSLWINDTVIRPLQSLMQRFASGAAGDFTTRMPVQSTDEIGQLAEYFNRFMDTLNRYGKNLRSEISRHKMTSQALQTSEEKYRTILERMEEGYFEVDLSGTFTFCNHAMGRILGVAEQQLLGSSISAWMDKKNAEIIATVSSQVRQSGQARQMSELAIVKADGTVCAVETSVSLRKDPEERAVGFSGVLRDVSKRKKSEKALRLSEEMFSKAFRSSPSGMFIAAQKDTRIINVNDSFLNITGCSLFDLIGKELLAIGFFHHRIDGERVMASLAEKAQVKNLEIIFLTKKGEKRTGMISVEQVTLWGEACMLGAIEDVTETRRLEREILTISERERQNIAMNLHDDLCPQLIGIEVMTKMLQSRLGEKAGDPDTALKEAERAGKIRALIHDSIEKTRQLAKGLSPVNVADRGFDASLADLAAYVREVFAIDCTLSCDSNQPFADNSLATHVYYIAQEAVQNAIKHARADKITITLMNRPDTIILTVADNGIGLNRAVVSQGMGIRIMSYRASWIGASIFFDTPKGGGTVVRLELART
ncbi:MAG: cache domain-containing protein [Proteobacteria bacterium]|nr:cache domain-containing protein [Pseudomonadota bacterium]